MPYPVVERIRSGVCRRNRYVLSSELKPGVNMLAKRYPQGRWAWVARIPPKRLGTLSVLMASFVLTGCYSSSKSSAPALAFSKVPGAEQESPYKTDITERDYKTDIIEGRATGARPGQRIVLYAKTDGRWGVCRQSGQPFANIETDGRWKASVHLGIQYAALLVDPTYNPLEQTESLPIVGNGVAALAIVHRGRAPPLLSCATLTKLTGFQQTTNNM